MKITFLGAAHEVTGSCTLIEAGDKKGIVDCGMEQGQDIFVNQELPVDPAALDFVLLTHAHIDHSGNLPLLYKRGFRGPIYASSATCSLCSIMLRDCAHIQMSDAEWKSRKAMRSGGAPVEPLYDLADAEGAIGCLRPVDYGRPVQVNESFTIRLTDVGHLLGSAAIEVWMTEQGQTRKLCFSGDIGNSNQPILQDPQPVKEADYLVMESTYGDRLHAGGRVDYVPALAQRIQTVLDRGGNVVIPSFAVGRTQEMLYFIREIKEKGLVKGHGDFPVYVDSPLAIEATSIFLQCDTQYVDAEMRELIRSGVNPIVFPGLKLAVSQAESQAINEDRTPKVILSASGMCDAGRIRHHLKHNLWRSECMVLFVGYQSVGTLGRRLVDGVKEVKLFNGLIQWLRGFDPKPKLTFINHGDPEAADSFTECLNTQLGYRAFAPYSGTSFDPLSGEFVEITQGRPVEPKAASGGRRVSPAFQRLLAAAERLLRVCRSLEGRSNRELGGYADKITKLANKMEK